MFQDVSLQVQSPHTLWTGNYSFTWASTHLCSVLTQPLLPCGRETLHNSSHISSSPLPFLTFQLFTIFLPFSLLLLMLFLASSFYHLLTNCCRSQQAAFVGVSTYSDGTNTHTLTGSKKAAHTHRSWVFLDLIYR